VAKKPALGQWSARPGTVKSNQTSIGYGHSVRKQISEEDQRLLELHSRRHLGLDERVAKRLRVSPSYVSLVARGKRRNEVIMAELLKELTEVEVEA
jgi:hypothetical protein